MNLLCVRPVDMPFEPADLRHLIERPRRRADRLCGLFRVTLPLGDEAEVWDGDMEAPWLVEELGNVGVVYGWEYRWYADLFAINETLRHVPTEAVGYQAFAQFRAAVRTRCHRVALGEGGDEMEPARWWCTLSLGTVERLAWRTAVLDRAMSEIGHMAHTQVVAAGRTAVDLQTASEIGRRVRLVR